MAKKYRCINHQNVAAATMCHQCHKPICKQCTVVMPHGQFCSTEHAALNKGMKQHLKGLKTSTPSKLTLAVGAVLLVLALTLI